MWQVSPVTHASSSSDAPVFGRHQNVTRTAQEICCQGACYVRLAERIALSLSLLSILSLGLGVTCTHRVGGGRRERENSEEDAQEITSYKAVYNSPV